MYARKFAFAVALGASLLAGGCAEDFFGPSDVAEIQGKVVDPVQSPIAGIGVAVLYNRTDLTASKPRNGVRPLSLAQGAVQVLPPYPNPADGEAGDFLTVTVESTVDTLVRVEAWTPVGGVFTRRTTIAESRIDPGTHTWVWDGTDDLRRPVANGLVELRVIVPTGGEDEVLPVSVIVNRQVAQLTESDRFNTVSNANGEYFLTDIAVGERFIRTNRSGKVEGEDRVQNEVFLRFVDLETPAQYTAKSEFVAIAPGDLVTQTTVMNPVAAAPAGIE